MTYRPYRPHALLMPLAGSVNPHGRRPPRSAPLMSGQQSPPGLLVGLLYGLPPALLLWAAIGALAKALF